MIIRKIFDGKFDDEIHVSFLKFGRGEYKDKYLLEGKKQSKDFAIKGGSEFANFFVRRGMEKLGGSINVKGVIVSTKNLVEEIPFEVKKVSNFQGVRKMVIETTVNSKDVIDLMNKYPKVFFHRTCTMPVFPESRLFWYSHVPAAANVNSQKSPCFRGSHESKALEPHPLTAEG